MAAIFFVPAEMSPGVARHNVGFFDPGMTLVLPDAASKGEKPSLKLVPTNAEAYDMLVKAHGEKAVLEKHGPKDKVAAPAPITSKKGADQKTVKQTGDEHAGR